MRTQPMTGHAGRTRTRLLAVCAAAALTVPLTAHAARAVVAARATVHRSAPSQAVPTDMAAGKLAPSGCTSDAGTASCDLWAGTGTTSLLGRTLPIWGFATNDTDPVTAPGPLLVVREGDKVTVTLHNRLAENVSLTFPGMAAAAFSGGLSPVAEDGGIATGETATYTFTATSPGTFLYEAGRTPNGARQVAMGLAGALVVLPADGAAGAYGAPQTAYDDEAVVVLSEVDPALNAAPEAFDMRSFNPRYRLINGKPFPSTDPIATDQGHTVLLRYVNAGSLPHPMSLLGAEQEQVAQDGHPMEYPVPSVVSAIEPGATMDTLVHMPSGPESKIMLYESSAHLDNDGQTGADATQTAFGGMMTFLDTAAPLPSGDSVGPVPSHVAVTPNPSDGRSDVTVSADLSDVRTGGSPVTQAEFVVDDARTTGPGFGTPMTANFGGTVVSHATGTIPATSPDCTTVSLACLDAGRHKVYVRALDAAGNWGVIGSAILKLPKLGPATRDGMLDASPANGSSPVGVSATGDDSDAEGVIDGAEYFIDDPTGTDGTGTPLTLNRSAAVVSEDGTIAADVVAALPEGEHHVYVHSHDSLGLWGPMLDLPLEVDKTGPTVTAGAVGPNPSNAAVSDPGNPGYLVVSAQVEDRDGNGGAQSVTTGAEGFLDPDTATPAEGTGFDLFAVDGKLDSQTEAVYGLVPLSEIRHLADGTHHVMVRAEDAAGNWGELFGIDLVVDRTAPVLGNLTAAPNPTGASTELTLTAPVNETEFSAAEFWTGSGDPAPGSATEVPIGYDVAAGTVTVSVPLGSVGPGDIPFNLRVQDRAGNWSNASSTVVTVSPTPANAPLGLLALRSGTVATTSAAGIPNTGQNMGLAMTMPGGRANAAAFAGARTATGLTAYGARFALDPHSLKAGRASVLSLFQGRTTDGARVFTVQLRSTRSGNQVRGVMDRPGLRPLSGDWVRLRSGAHHLGLTWTGASRGSSRGSLQVVVDGRRIFEESGKVGGFRLAQVRLGVVGGFTGTTRGTAYFDGYETVRTPTR